MKSKISKILKILCIVFAAVILVVVLGGIIFYNAFLKDRAKNVIEIIDNVIYDEEFLEDLETYEVLDEIDKYIEKENQDESPNENPNETQNEIKNENPNEISNKDEKLKPSDVIGAEGSAEAIINNAKNNFVSGQNTAPESPKNTDTTEKTEGNVPQQTKPTNDYKSKYDSIKDKVAPQDFTKALNFASRIDTQYVLGLLSGGLSAEEKSELKKYLKKNFSSSEISQGIALYSKYAHLLK